MNETPSLDSKERLERRLAREKRARAEAESLLEEKSRALYDANQALEISTKAARQAANQLRAILDHLPSAVIVASPDGKIRWVNFTAQGLFGTTSQLAHGKDISSLLPKLADPAHATQIRASRATDPMTSAGRRCDGSDFPAEVTHATVGEDHDTNDLWIVRDLTHRHMLEERRQKLEADLQRAHRLESLGTMAGGIAHELNTPIQFITDNTNFLAGAFKDLLAAIDGFKAKLPAEEGQKIEDAFDIAYLRDELPQAIEQSLEGLSRVAEIVLAIKRFSHPATATKDANDLNDIIRTTVTVSKNQWKYVSELDLDLDPDLPLLKSNAGELNQVFLNLIVNAAHAIEDRGQKGTPGSIRISTRKQNGWIECRVSDTGTGMPQDVADKAFDLFFTTKAPGRGTGQGLSLVHAIVTQSHRGTIEIESEPGAGTTFILKFPLTVDDPADAA